MKPVGSFIIALAARVVGFACERSPIEPPRSVITADLLKQTGLLQCSVMPSQSVKQTIGPAGGTLKIGPHILVVPPGALATRVTIAAKSADRKSTRLNSSHSQISYAVFCLKKKKKEKKIRNRDVK